MQPSFAGFAIGPSTTLPRQDITPQAGSNQDFVASESRRSPTSLHGFRR